MGRLPEPDDIDFIVAGHDSDPESIKETMEYIKALKSRPEHAEEVRQAILALESLRINSTNYQTADPEELLAQWQKTREALQQRKSQESVVVGEPGEGR